MAIKNTLNYFSRFHSAFSFRIRKIYLSSSFYNKKISKISDKILIYKPSPSLINCIIKYTI